MNDEAEREKRRARRDIERELAADHYRRTFGEKLKKLAADMRAEVARTPGVIRLDQSHKCHCCGCPVDEEAQSKVNPNLYLCWDCRHPY